MKNFLRTIIVSGIIASASAGFAQAETITAYTGALPPFTISAEEKGISHEVVEEIAKRSGLDIQIEYLPWKRAQVTAENTPGSLLFTLNKTEAREPKYHWVVEFFPTNWVFVTQSDPVNSLEEAESLSGFVVLANTPRSRSLKETDLTNWSEVENAKLAARMLDGGRVDAWYTLEARASNVFKQEGLDPSSLVIGEPLKSAPVWLAAHKDFDPAISEKIKMTFEEIKADGTLENIRNKYLK